MRFYVSPEGIFPERDTVEIRDKKEVHHIRDVMRLEKGISIIVFDGRGREYSGDIKEIHRDSVVIEIKKHGDSKSDISYNVTLYQAIPRKGKMDSIVEKAVELGVSAIVPVITDRTVPLIKERIARNIERWARITKAASKQCGRVIIPAISDAADFHSALVESKKSDLVLFAALDKDREPLSAILKGIKPKNIALFIGPEGDFSQREISMAKEQGYRICSLGPLVLKVETAAIYILSSLNYEYSS